MNDPKKSLARKRMAYKAAKTIVRQMRDRKLIKLRHRLIKAARAHDERIEWKLTNLIRDYLKEEKMDA